MTANARFSMAVHIMTAMAYLGEKVSSAFLSKSVNTNPVVVRRLLGDLNRAGLIKAERGKAGGFMLARSPREISLLAVYRSVMKDEALMNLHDNPESKGCVVSCKVRGVLSKHLQKAQNVYERELEKIYLSDINKVM